MAKKGNSLGLLLISMVFISSLCAEEPRWIRHLPFADDAFFGVGHGSNLEEAVEKGKADILMQLSSQVQAVITMEENSRGGEFTATEKLETFIGSNSLRAAEVEDCYEANGIVWVLMKYCDDCGKMLVDSALKRYEEDYSYSSEVVLERFDSESTREAVRIERRLEELDLEEYSSEDISISLLESKMIIRILNFLPYETDLKPSQQNALQLLSTSLLKELEDLDYQGVSIVGHANPTGESDEERDLEMLSRNRAETMARFLRSAGILINDISWKGGREIIGHTGTLEGRGKNRRVDIIIELKNGGQDE